MKYRHKVFHTVGVDDRRSELVEKINDYLYLDSLILDTPTFKISNREEYNKFLLDNPDFKPDTNGYELDGFRGWKMGEIGIWASNWTAWNNFLKSEDEYLILMEDDIVHNEEFLPMINYYLSQLPDDWDIFHAFSPADQFNKYNETHDIGARDICKAYQDWSCLCYIINKRGAKKLLLNSDMFNLPLDWYMFRQQDKFNIYTIKPSSESPCTLMGIESTFQLKENREVL
jgi:GR25 family glycosyltransferase involved in LPS biosynthesis